MTHPPVSPICAGRLRRVLSVVCVISVTCAGVVGCDSLSVRDRNTLAVAAGIGVLGNSPTSEIEQVYYLGVFDPQDQIPPLMYRVRVRGQSGALNQTNFASGWVRSEVIDSLATSIRFEAGDVKIGKDPADPLQTITAGRRLVMFGPEGFREAPKDHRLVIVMGASPEKFFQGVDEALGTVAQAIQGQGAAVLDRSLFTEMLNLRTQKERLIEFSTQIKADDAASAGAK